SELFLGERNEKSPGAAVFAGMEGTRPILVEVQALVAATSRRTWIASASSQSSNPFCRPISQQ
ncbi:MAG: hypothetical protein ACT6TC_10985, partial [Caulobacteraceae bacterium]